MKFEKDARKAGVLNMLTGDLILAALIALQVLVFNKKETSIGLIVIFWVVGLFASLTFIRQGLILMKAGGKWEVTVDTEGIDWSSPDEAIDKSFRLHLDEIERVDMKISKAGKSRSRRFVLVAKSGEEIKLSPNSGINLVRVADELEKLGVEVRPVPW